MTYNHETDTDDTPAFTTELFIDSYDNPVCVACASTTQSGLLKPYTYIYDPQIYAFDALCEHCLTPIYETINGD